MERELRILLIEDSLPDAEFLQHELRRGGVSFTVRRVTALEAFIEQLEEFQPDLIISDYLLPSFNGLTALKLVREQSREIPFILVSGYIGEERAAEALKSGATDFLLKSNLATRLVPTVRRAIRDVKDRAERERLEDVVRQAQKLEAVGKLTGGIAHDFNNILGVVVGNLDLAAERLAGDSKTLALVEAALKGALRGADLVQRLLAFSRRQRLAPDAIDVNGRLSNLIAMLYRTLGEDIAIAPRSAENLWLALADASQLENAILNLAINARDAMPRGGTLTIETANAHLDADYAARNPEVVPGDYVMIAVTDNGTGMPPEIVERAFEPFFTTKETGKGTGLGLSMVYGFAKQSGGHVKIYSEFGNGTTVKLYLPRTFADAVDAKAAASVPPETVPMGCESILLVEDNGAMREATRHLLEGLGYRVREAENGPAALAAIDSGVPIDLLFTDVVMPDGMSGYDLAAETAKRRPGIKVLFTTGYAEASVRNAGSIANETIILSKPYRKSVLSHAVRRALDAGAGGER